MMFYKFLLLNWDVPNWLIIRINPNKPKIPSKTRSLNSKSKRPSLITKGLKNWIKINNHTIPNISRRIRIFKKKKFEIIL